MALRKRKTETKAKHKAVLRDLDECESKVKRLQAQLDIATETIIRLLKVNGRAKHSQG